MGLKRKLTKKYLLKTHPKFQHLLGKIEIVLELINGSNVSIDLENTSKESVTVPANQLMAVLVERRPKVAVKGQDCQPPSLPNFARKKEISPGGVKSPLMLQKMKVVEKNGTVEARTGTSSSLQKYNVSLEESIVIQPKSVSYAQVSVMEGDQWVFNKVHEIRRHPEFRNNAIFVPERQKKKIHETEKLHMSLRNRLDAAHKLEKGTVVGQIVVQLPVAATAAIVPEAVGQGKRSRTPSTATNDESSLKRLKVESQSRAGSRKTSPEPANSRQSTPPPPPPASTADQQGKQKILALLKNAYSKSGTSAEVGEAGGCSHEQLRAHAAFNKLCWPPACGSRSASFIC